MTTWLLCGLKSKTLTRSNDGEDLNNNILDLVLVKMQDHTLPLEDSLAVCYKNKPILIILANIFTLSVYPNEMTAMSTQKPTYKCS
jgi:hypothetical protein